jgi:cytochrome c-type biogenesis protein CcmF
MAKLGWTRDTTQLTAIFNHKLKLPMQLVCFGFVAWTASSIAQEYVQGLIVRMKQTGSDPVTSLVGMMLMKRRRYGGYIVHLGVAVMFIGFAGKAWDTKQFFEVAQPAGPVEAAKGEKLTAEELRPSTFWARNYKLVYWELRQETDDNKHAVTAVVKLYKDGELLETIEPAKWTFNTKDTTTSEVAIHPRLAEDVYVVLDHYDAETHTATFVVYINPLINWVWIGILILILGTFWCLIPQVLVDAVSARPRTRLGRAADIALLLLIVFGTIAGTAAAAQAQGAGMEHEDTALPQRGHMDGGGYAATYRPEMAASPEARRLADRLMKGLVCMCGGCNRENLYDCKCAYAADERKLVLALLDDGATSDDVVGAFVKRYGGEQVLNEPSNSLSWILPYVAILGGLGLVVVLGTRWVKRGRAEAAKAPAASAAPVDPDKEEEYAEKLDDELAEID